MNTIGFLDAFYRAKHDQAGLLNDLGSLLASESAAVRLIPFGCETESLEWLGQATPAGMIPPGPVGVAYALIGTIPFWAVDHIP